MFNRINNEGDELKVSVLFVCLGNICRSPAGEEVLRHMAKKQGVDVEVASCGLGDWHLGQLADDRMRKAASDRGIVLTGRAQILKDDFFDKYDYILAADHIVMQDLNRIALKPSYKAKINLMTAYSKSYPNQELPDPYYGGSADFNFVLDVLQDACEGLLEEIKKKSL